MTSALIAPEAKVIFFDLDDTLVDSHAAFGAAISASVAELLNQESDDAKLLAAWRGDAGGFYAQYTRGEISYEQQRRLRLEHLIGAHVAEQEFSRWNDTFTRVFEESWRIFPDAGSTLIELAHRGLSVGVITNGPHELQEQKLQATGLGHIPVVVSVDTLGVGKPSPQVFEYACRTYDVAAYEAMYVGDELENDAIGALAAGMPGVWLDRPGRRKGGVYQEDERLAQKHQVPVISTLSQLLGQE